MDQFFIRPAVAEARLVDPANGDLLDAAGQWKPRSTYWLRAELRGDVEQCDPPAEVGAEPVTPEVATAPSAPEVTEDALVAQLVSDLAPVTAPPEIVSADPAPASTEAAPVAEAAPEPVVTADQPAPTRSAISTRRDR